MSMTKAVDALDLNTAVVNGAAASTNMAVSGIATEDTIVFAQGFADTTAAPTDRTSTITITSAGNIQSSANLSAESLLLLWHDGSGEGYDCLDLQFTVVAGQTASTNMAVTGLATEDTLIWVWECDDTSGLWTDRTATTTITSAGNVQSTDDCSGGTMWVCYHDASGAGFDAPCLKWTQCNGSATTSTVTGIATEDTLLAVVELLVADYFLTDRTATTTITAANTITSGVSTVNDILLVFWHDASA